MKAFILLILLAQLCISQAWAQDGEAPVGRAAALALANTNASSMLTGLYAGDLSPEEFGEMLLGFAENFYVSGYISLEQSTTKRQEADSCVAIEKQYRNASGNLRDALRAQRNDKCGQAVNFQSLAANAPACVGPGAVAAGAECCGGLNLGVSLSLEATLTSCVKSNLECAGHAECCSKVCQKDEGEAKGICAPTLACFPTIPLNGECTLENANCAAGVCRVQDLGLEGVQCKALDNACSASDECCSGKCASGKCAEKMTCTACITEGQKPSGSNKCCPGFIKDTDGACVREMPPFILPTTTRVWRFLSNLVLGAAHAQEVDGDTQATTPVLPTTTVSTGKTSVGAVVNDGGLTRGQLDMIEDLVRGCLGIKDQAQRATCLRSSYDKRKGFLADNNAAAAAGKPVSNTFTQDEYVQRYNIPAITPKTRSNVQSCEFNSLKDNWLDASNLQRNAELFIRSFEVSYSGKGTQDFWHLPNASGAVNPQNIHTRTKGLMSELRENRHAQKDQLAYLDLMMSCQCMYTFGVQKFDADKQAFFFSMCTGQPENKLCRDGQMRESLKLADSPEQAYRDGVEFPNYVEMYFANINKVRAQAGNKTDVMSMDSSSAGINHEEVLVRWLRMRSCNQVDVFIDTEAVEGELQNLADDIVRAKKPVPHLTAYWTKRLADMKKAKVDKKIIQYFEKDTNKDTWFRGYVDTESKVGGYSKKIPTFLLFLLILLLGLAAMAFIGVMVGAVTLGGGLAVTMMLSGGGGGTATKVLDTFLKDFPNPIIETREVEKKTCMMGLFYCLKYSRILHWPAFSNAKGIESAFPFNKDEKRKCEDVAAQAAALPGAQPNGCSGPFKGTMCARTFYRPIADAKIAGAAAFAPWGEFMKDKMLMDPVLPDFLEEETLVRDFGWKGELTEGFKKGCAWANKIGKKNVKAEDKLQFLPNLDKYMDGQQVFKPAYQFGQARIDAYKAAVAKYAMCDDLTQCGAKSYDGKHPRPRGFKDIVENQEQAELLANYVYQIHFKWRHMSSTAGIGYPLAYIENYYLALLHNVRLLTTLSVRRGLELDDAFNRYAQDLAVRRSQYQVTGQDYGVGTGVTPTTPQVQVSQYYQSLRTMGFPLTGSFAGIEPKGSLNDKGMLGSGISDSASLSGTAAQGLAAARRHSARVAEDNAAMKNFKAQTSGAASQKRLASAARFFGNVNSPIGALGAFGNPKDSSSYAGFGDLAKGTMDKDAKATQTASAAPRDIDVSGGQWGAGASNGAGGPAGGVVTNFSDLDPGVGAGADAADTDADKELKDAARLTGMGEGDVQKLLQQADSERGKNQSSQDDGLFDKVSKAYMRNIDRVLIRKRGAAPAPAAAPGDDKEKAEIRKLME